MTHTHEEHAACIMQQLDETFHHGITVHNMHPGEVLRCLLLQGALFCHYQDNPEVAFTNLVDEARRLFGEPLVREHAQERMRVGTNIADSERQQVDAAVIDIFARLGLRR